MHQWLIIGKLHSTDFDAASFVFHFAFALFFYKNEMRSNFNRFTDYFSRNSFICVTTKTANNKHQSMYIFNDELAHSYHLESRQMLI